MKIRITKQTIAVLKVLKALGPSTTRQIADAQGNNYARVKAIIDNALNNGLVVVHAKTGELYKNGSPVLKFRVDQHAVTRARNLPTVHDGYKPPPELNVRQRIAFLSTLPRCPFAHMVAAL